MEQKSKPRPRTRTNVVQSVLRVARVDVGAAVVGWGRRNPAVVGALVVSIFVSVGIVRHWPLNGPGEWRWHYSVHRDFWPPFLWSLTWLAPGVAVCGGVWAAWARGRGVRGRRRIAGALLLAWGLYYQWVVSTTALGLGPTHWGRTVLRATSTGYYQVAQWIGTERLPPLAELLRRYPEFQGRMPLHARTHPPGPVLAAHGLRRLFETHPGLTRVSVALFVSLGMRLDRMPPVPLADQAAATVLGLLLILAGLSVIYPLRALILRSMRGKPEAERVAWGAAILWVHLPTLLIFSPQFDQAFPVLILMGLLMGLKAMEGRGLAWGVGLGAVVALGAFISFKLLVWIPLGFAICIMFGAVRSGSFRPSMIWKRWWEDRPRRRSLLRLIIASGLTFTGLMAGLKLVFGINMAAIISQALVQQRAFIEEVGRSYTTWLIFGPYDFLLLAGPGLSLLALLHGGRVAWRGARGAGAIEPLWAVYPLGVGLIALAGLMRGENARLWLMFAPGLVWAAAAWLARGPNPAFRANLIFVLAAQHIFLYVCLANMYFMDR